MLFRSELHQVLNKYTLASIWTYIAFYQLLSICMRHTYFKHHYLAHGGDVLFFSVFQLTVPAVLWWPLVVVFIQESGAHILLLFKCQKLMIKQYNFCWSGPVNWNNRFYPYISGSFLCIVFYSIDKALVTSRANVTIFTWQRQCGW